MKLVPILSSSHRWNNSPEIRDLTDQIRWCTPGSCVLSTRYCKDCDYLCWESDSTFCVSTQGCKLGCESGSEMAMKRMMQVVVVVALVVVAVAPAAQAFDGSFKFSACNLSTSKAGSPFEKAAVAVLANLASETPFNSYDYLNNQVNSGSTAFGRGSCRYGLADCTACLQEAGKQIRTACPHAVGARLQIGDCFIQYESQAIQSI